MSLWNLSEDDDQNEEKKDEQSMSEKMLQTRTIVVAEVVTDKLYRKVASALFLLEQEDPDKAITVMVNSPGGSADSGFAIYDLFRFSSCPIITIANGIVASSGVLIYLGGNEKMHLSLPHARFLLHQPSMSSRGQASDLTITSQEIQKIRRRYNEIVEKHTGKDADIVTKDSERDFWLSAQESQEYGLVNHVIEFRSDIKKYL